jgi:hypothetical protein
MHGEKRIYEFFVLCIEFHNPHADKILLKLSAAHKTFGRPGLSASPPDFICLLLDSNINRGATCLG